MPPTETQQEADSSMKTATRYDQRLAEKLFRANQGDDTTPNARAIARLNTSPRELEFARQNRAMDAVMVSIRDVHQLVNEGEDARSTFGDETTVISTTTVRDSFLNGFEWADERDWVRDFGPDIHIPTDYPVYEDMPPHVQGRMIWKSKLGTAWMTDQLRGEETVILPQIKGWRPWHFKAWRPILDKLNTRFCAYYVAGYKGNLTALKADVTQLINTLQPTSITLIGRQSRNHLSQLPPEVQAAAGKAWLQASETEAGDLCERRLRQFFDTIELELGSGQTMLSSVYASEVISNG